MRALKEAGLVAIAARSFAHIFHRTALNLGIPPLVLSGQATAVETGTTITVDTADGTLSLKGVETMVEGWEPYERHLLAAGGLENFLAGKDWRWE